MVVVEADLAKVLGQAMAQQVGPPAVPGRRGVDNGDYIDIGAPWRGEPSCRWW